MERYRTLISEHSATDIQVKVWGKKRLAYPIKKLNDGVYVQMNYQASGKQVAPMERAMRLSDEVIRYLTLKLDRVVAPPCRFISLNGNSPLSYHRSGGGR